MRRLFLLLGFAALLHASARGGNDAPAAPPPATAQTSGTEKPALLQLVTDHLPAALYEGEPLTACFRVENAAEKEARVEVRAEVLDARGEVLRRKSTAVAAVPKALTACRQDCDPSGGAAVRFVLAGPEGELSGPALRLQRDENRWPKTAVRGGRLVEAESNEVLVVVTRKRLLKEDRTWSLLRWGVQPKEGRARGTLIVPGAWGELRAGKQEAKPELDLEEVLPASARNSGEWFALGPYPADGCPPMLRALGEVAAQLTSSAPARVVLVLPPEDLETATEARAYRILLEALLTRLESAGVRETVLWPPFRYGSETGGERLKEECLGAVTGRPARVEEVAEFLNEKFWRVDPRKEGAYGRKPNSDGLKKIAQKLSELLP
jgi:hypothetical protein